MRVVTVVGTRKRTTKDITTRAGAGPGEFRLNRPRRRRDEGFFSEEGNVHNSVDQACIVIVFMLDATMFGGRPFLRMSI